jgi:hypothetical protein
MQWGVGAAILAATGYKISPIYRGLTFQFKVYASPRTNYSERFLGDLLMVDVI